MGAVSPEVRLLGAHVQSNVGYFPTREPGRAITRIRLQITSTTPERRGEVASVATIPPSFFC